jgi:protein SCO1
MEDAMADKTAAPAPSSVDAHARQIPNVFLRTQDGELVRLYDDLIKGKIALINFFYTRCSGVCGLTMSHLVKVQEAFGLRLGREVVMLSVTIDPIADTPRTLKEYCRRLGTRPGWYLVTGNPMDIELLRVRFGVRDRDAPANTHTALAVYGNADTGQWASTPVLGNPLSIARNVTRLVELAN